MIGAGRFRLAAWTALLLGPPLAVLALLWAVLQPAPAAPPGPPPTVEEAALLRRLLLMHDPRRAGVDGTRTVQLSGRDAERLLDHALRHRLQGGARLRLQPGHAELALSVPAPAGAPRGWINVEARLAQRDGLPTVERLRVGRLPLPGWLGDRLLARAAAGLVRGAAFSATQLRIDYDWTPQTRERLLAAWLPAADRQRLRAYTERLAALTAAPPPAGAIPLAALLEPLFALARERSADGGDAAREHRALLLTLASYVGGRRLDALVPEARQWPQPRRRPVTLGGREDFAMHFAISAALASEAGGPLADAVGVYKEVVDTAWGSGFSFNDIAIDRAGARFGERALRAPRQLQAALAGGIREHELLPDLGGLPEFLSAAEFRARYGGVGAPAYNAMLAEIDARVAAVALLR